MRRISAILVASAVLLPGYAQAEFKMGYIDSQVIKEKLPDFKQAQQQLERLQQQYESDANDRQSKLLKLEEDFRKQELLMSEARKEQLRTELGQKERELQEFAQKIFGPGGELMQKNVELSQPIFEKVNTVLQTIGKEEGYDLIVDVGAPNSAVVYTPEKYDLTQKLLDRLLKEAEKQTTGTGK
jgi:outer membrane protein